MNHPVVMERQGQFETPGEAEALRAFLTPLFDLTLMNDAPVSISCHARATGGGLVVRLDAGSLELERAVGAARHGGWDHRLLLLVSAGSCENVVTEPCPPLRPGDLALFDMARSFRIRIEDTARLVLMFLPRSSADGSLPQHGLRLGAEDVMNVLLGPPIRLLADSPTALPATQASALMDAIALLALAPSSDPAENGSDRSAGLWALMDECAPDADWPPGRMAAALGLSRTGLYRLAASEGGVSTLREDAKLRRAVALLMDTSQPPPSVADLARSAGFASPTHFARLFRQRFTLSPQDFRTRFRDSGDARLDPRFALWLESGRDGDRHGTVER